MHDITELLTMWGIDLVCGSKCLLLLNAYIPIQYISLNFHFVPFRTRYTSIGIVTTCNVHDSSNNLLKTTSTVKFFQIDRNLCPFPKKE